MFVYFQPDCICVRVCVSVCFPVRLRMWKSLSVCGCLPIHCVHECVLICEILRAPYHHRYWLKNRLCKKGLGSYWLLKMHVDWQITVSLDEDGCSVNWEFSNSSEWFSVRIKWLTHDWIIKKNQFIRIICSWFALFSLFCNKMISDDTTENLLKPWFHCLAPH